jgi:hypothetical protein
MRRIVFPTLGLIAAALLWAGISLASRASGPADVTSRPMPEFPTHDPNLWINAAPIAASDLKGQVVLLDVWTFG